LHYLDRFYHPLDQIRLRFTASESQQAYHTKCIILRDNPGICAIEEISIGHQRLSTLMDVRVRMDWQWN